MVDVLVLLIGLAVVGLVDDLFRFACSCWYLLISDVCFGFVVIVWL